MGISRLWSAAGPFLDRYECSMSTDALIVAAGRGTRAAHPSGLPKQYASIAGIPVLARSLAAFVNHSGIRRVKVMIGAGDRDFYATTVQSFADRLLPPSLGGETRQETVRLGLSSLSDDPPQRILIHDAARPFIDAGTITRVIAALDQNPGAIAAEPLTDTLKRASSAGVISETIDRAGLWRAQTPQGFRFADILAAHERATAAGLTSFTDDAGLAEWAGLEVALVASGTHNDKLTTAEDLAIADKLLGTNLETRTGTGFDVHSFAPGDHVWLCGVKIPHIAKLEGHSDADVALHALTDAILGAIGDGDIGQHFPPSDQRWKGAASHIFLEDAKRRVAERGGRISNVDVTLLCEAPKIAPHRDAMRAAIAAMLSIDVGRVGVKATTMEGLGFVGRREGIAAMAVATVLLP